MYQVGDVIAGYRVLAVLGTGGMGEVYKVAHPRLPRADALKILRSAHATDPVFRARFEREADLVAPLQHPNIVAVYDRGVVDDQLWIAMEFVPGTDAAQMVEDHGALDPRLAVAIIGGVAAGLDAAHRRGVMHRDIKPANILVTPGESRFQPDSVKLTDFGIAQAFDEATSLTGTGTTVGTLRYSSPEQIEGRRLDARSDIYSLGATAYELLTGAPPFDAPTLHGLMSAHIFAEPPRATTRNRGLPPAVDDVLRRSIAKDPAHRYGSAREFASALHGAFDTRDTLVGAAPPRPMTAPQTTAPQTTAPQTTAPPTMHGPGMPGPDTIQRAHPMPQPPPRLMQHPPRHQHVPNPHHEPATVQPATVPPADRPRPWYRRAAVLGPVLVLLAALVGVGAGLLQNSGAALAAPDRPDATVNKQAVALAWNAVDGATDYIVKQNDTVIYSGPATSYAVPLPLPGTYSYSVAARRTGGSGSGFSLASAPVTVFLTWRGLQWIADLYPDLVPSSPLSTNGFDKLSCFGDSGSLSFDTTQQSIICKKMDGDLTTYTVTIYGYATADETRSAAKVMIVGSNPGTTYTTSQGTVGTRTLRPMVQNPAGATAVFTFSTGPRTRTYVQVDLDKGTPAQAGDILARLPF
ncbi:protein kinase domain-containing protein [Gordonia sp. NPDC003429]